MPVKTQSEFDSNKKSFEVKKPKEKEKKRVTHKEDTG